MFFISLLLFEVFCSRQLPLISSRHGDTALFVRMTSNEKLRSAKKRLAELKKRNADANGLSENVNFGAVASNSGSEEPTSVVDEGSVASKSEQKLARALEEIALLKEQNRRFRDKIGVLEAKLAGFEASESQSPAQQSRISTPSEPKSRQVSFGAEDVVIPPLALETNPEFQPQSWQLDLRGWRTVGVGPQIDL